MVHVQSQNMLYTFECQLVYTYINNNSNMLLFGVAITKIRMNLPHGYCLSYVLSYLSYRLVYLVS